MEMFQSKHFLLQKCIMDVEKHSICAFRMLYTGLRYVQFPPPLKQITLVKQLFFRLRYVQFPPPLKLQHSRAISDIRLRYVQFPPPLKLAK